MIATASTQDKLDWLLSLPNGATNAANYKTQDFSQVTKEVTQNKGVDVVIDFVLVSRHFISLQGQMIFFYVVGKVTLRKISHRSLLMAK